MHKLISILGLLISISWLAQSSADSITFEQLVQNSSAFEKDNRFPSSENRIINFATSQKLKLEVVEHAIATRPIIHAKVLQLIDDFLDYKKMHGTPREKQLYKSLSRDQFIDRLLKKRPLMFITGADIYLLKKGIRGAGGFESIGTEQEKEPLTLKEYLSYDEMQISSLLAVSVPTHFINDGDRNNKALKGRPGTYQEKGVYVAIVGPRFEKEGLMEYRHIIITKFQNTTKAGYGPEKKDDLLNIWAKFYDIDHFPTYEEVLNDKSGNYVKVSPDVFINKEIYKKRMYITAEVLLTEANERAKENNSSSYTYLAGTGLGVWLVHPDQKQWLKEVYLDILRSKSLPDISDVAFGWASAESEFFTDIKEGQLLGESKNHITLHTASQNSAAKLVGKNANKLLVTSYAWDGNSYPGNEYWIGCLNASADPAAACCSMISELQNPDINPNVSSKNVRIYK